MTLSQYQAHLQIQAASADHQSYYQVALLSVLHQIELTPDDPLRVLAVAHENQIPFSVELTPEQEDDLAEMWHARGDR